jgi:fructose-specific PTS system IIA-like component
MAQVIKFRCDLPNGVHARPASLVETLCNTFVSSIDWWNTRSDLRGNAKSALAIIATNTIQGDECQLMISGEDEQRAFAALSAFIDDQFPHCDTPLPTAESMEVQPVPESLSRLNPLLFHGLPCVPGAQGACSSI